MDVELLLSLKSPFLKYKFGEIVGSKLLVLVLLEEIKSVSAILSSWSRY
jgi:hypothetical protein